MARKKSGNADISGQAQMKLVIEKIKTRISYCPGININTIKAELHLGELGVSPEKIQQLLEEMTLVEDGIILYPQCPGLPTYAWSDAKQFANDTNPKGTTSPDISNEEFLEFLEAHKRDTFRQLRQSLSAFVRATPTGSKVEPSSILEGTKKRASTA